MFPGVGNSPNYTNEFETFEELKKDLEATYEDLNQIQSWGFYEPDKYSEPGEQTEFSVVIFMPRKTQTTQFVIYGMEPTDELKLWIEHYLRPRALRWFDVGWKGGGDD